jgi:hypothetical protein
MNYSFEDGSDPLKIRSIESIAGVDITPVETRFEPPYPLVRAAVSE